MDEANHFHMPPPTVNTTRPILPTVAPTLWTTRLLLRALTAADLPAYNSIRSSSAVMTFSKLHAPDVDIDYTWTILSPLLRTPGSESYLFGVEERSNPGVLIGNVGVHEGAPGREELGCMYLEREWGKGYATEALVRFLDEWWGLQRVEVERHVLDGEEGGQEVREMMSAVVEAEHAASLKVLEKCGFKERKRSMHEDGRVRLLLVLERPGGS